MPTVTALENRGVRRNLPEAVRNAFSDVLSIVEEYKGPWKTGGFRKAYTGLLSAHLSDWGVPKQLAPQIAGAVFELHKNVWLKVSKFLEDTYGNEARGYSHELILNALHGIYQHANTEGLLEDISRSKARRDQYIGTLMSVAKAVQRNFAITDHLIREGYRLAPYLANLDMYPALSSLVQTAFRRRDIRAVSDLRHLIEIVLQANNSDNYFDVIERTLRKQLKAMGRTEFSKKHGVRRHVARIVPFALHAALIDTEVEGGPGKAIRDVAEFLYGSRAHRNWPYLYAMTQNHSLYPVLIGFAKHWNGNLNDLLSAALYRYLHGGPTAMAELVHNEGRVAWEDLWKALSTSVHHRVSLGNKELLYFVGKRSPIVGLAANSEIPTCFYPANEEGQRYGVDYVLNPRNGNTMPVIATVHEINKRRGKEKIVGRATFFVDPDHGNIFITSTPVGNARLDHVIELAKKYGEKINAQIGDKIIKRVVVGGIGRHKFRLFAEDAYDDFIVQEGGRHYVRNAKVIPLE